MGTNVEGGVACFQHISILRLTMSCVWLSATMACDKERGRGRRRRRRRRRKDGYCKVAFLRLYLFEIDSETLLASVVLSIVCRVRARVRLCM